MENANWIEYVIIKCLYCNQQNTIKNFHQSYKMKVNDEPGKILVRCPRCNKRMELLSLDWKKFDGEEKKVTKDVI